MTKGIVTCTERTVLVSLQVSSTIVLRSGPFQHRSPPMYSIFVCSALSHEPHSLHTAKHDRRVCEKRPCLRKENGNEEEPERVPEARVLLLDLLEGGQLVGVLVGLQFEGLIANAIERVLT